MTWPPTSVSRAASRLGLSPGRLGLTVGSGGVGGFSAHLASVSRTPAIIVGIGLVIAVIAHAVAGAVESIWKRRPQVIKAKGEARAAIIKAEGDAATAIIKARSEAEALRTRTVTRAELELSVSPEQMEEVLRLRPTDIDLPENRRMSDEAVIKLLATRPKGDGTKPKGAPPPVLRSVQPSPPGG